jgi:adenosylhomocysteine nucleosidase
MIGLIAIRNEADALLKFITVEATTEHFQTRFHRGHLAGRPVVLAEVSPGKVQTAAATQHLIDGHGVDMMLSCGSAGALAPQLQVGDIVLADALTLHDFGLYAKGDFQHLGFFDHNHPDGLHYRRMLPVDPSLLAAAQQAAHATQWPEPAPAIRTGCLVSGDQVIADATKKQWLHDTFNALAVDMESGAMAQVAVLNNIPWLAVRAVSDSADSTVDLGQQDFITYTDESATPLTRLKKSTRTAGRIIGTAARNPGVVKSALNFRQAIKQAAANAATVTVTIISRLE